MIVGTTSWCPTSGLSRYPNELRNVVSLKTTKAATLRKKTYLNAAIHRSSRRPKGAGTIRRMRSSD